MIVIFQSFYLYLLGVVADVYRAWFNRAVRKAAARGDISSHRLIVMSDRSYILYKRFYEVEKLLQHKLECKARDAAIRL